MVNIDLEAARRGSLPTDLLSCFNPAARADGSKDTSFEDHLRKAAPPSDNSAPRPNDPPRSNAADAPPAKKAHTSRSSRTEDRHGPPAEQADRPHDSAMVDEPDEPQTEDAVAVSESQASVQEQPGARDETDTQTTSQGDQAALAALAVVSPAQTLVAEANASNIEAEVAPVAVTDEPTASASPDANSAALPNGSNNPPASPVVGPQVDQPITAAANDEINITPTDPSAVEILPQETTDATAKTDDAHPVEEHAAKVAEEPVDQVAADGGSDEADDGKADEDARESTDPRGSGTNSGESTQDPGIATQAVQAATPVTQPQNRPSSSSATKGASAPADAVPAVTTDSQSSTTKSSGEVPPSVTPAPSLTGALPPTDDPATASDPADTSTVNAISVDNKTGGARSGSVGGADAAVEGGQQSRLSEVERVRLVQRVARAFQSVREQGGQLRLRLSPPELGSLRLEVTVRDGALSARLEAETPAAQAVLLDNLPALRDRLAEQQIRLERFDVDLMDRQPGDTSQHAMDGREGAAPRSRNLSGAREPQEQREGETIARRPVVVGQTQLNVVI